MDPDCYYYLSKLGLTADNAGLTITSLEHLADGESGAELLLVAEHLAFAFVVEVRPATITLFPVPVDGNATTARFRILGTDNTSENWERMTLAVLRLGLRWRPRDDWTKALAKPIELDDVVVCA